MEQLYKIVLSGTDTPIEGCESMSIEEVSAWTMEFQEAFEEPNEVGDNQKYIIIPLESAE